MKSGARRVVVTRPRAQAEAFAQRLRTLGVDAAVLPLLAIAPARDPAAVQRARERLALYTLAVFVSPNAVQHFAGGSPAAFAWPAGTLAGSTGPGTSAALRAAGVPEAALVEPAADAAAFDSEALWQQLQRRRVSWAGQRVLVVRGDEGRDWLAQTLREAGAEVDFVAAYRRAEPRLDDAGRALLQAACEEPRLHLWHFSSSEAVRTLQRFSPGQDWSAASALASHPRIVQAARQAGFGRVDAVGVRPEDVAEMLRRP